MFFSVFKYLSQLLRDLYNENYKILMKGNGEDNKKWKGLLCSRIGRTFLNMFIQAKVMYRFTAVSIKTPVTSQN
jgi:hypothetical protein